MLAFALLLSVSQDPAFASAEHGFALRVVPAEWSVAGSEADGLLLRVVAQPPADRLAEAGGPGFVQMRVEVARATATAEEARDATFAQLDSITEVKASERLERIVAGISAPGLEIEYHYGGTPLTLRQYFLVGHGRLYRFQVHAPAAHWEGFGEELEACLDAFEWIELAPGAYEEEILHALAARCGSEVAWAQDWEDAARRAREERKLVLVAVQAYGGFEVGDLLATGTFMDPDVVGLVQTRFVPLRFRIGMAAPFTDPAVYGLSGSSFGLGLLLATPDGSIVRETFAVDGVLVARFLRDALGGHPRLAAPPPAPAEADASGRIAWLQRCGALAEADRAIEALAAREGTEIAAHRARAEQHRLRMQGEGALDELHEATMLAKSDPALLAALEEERAQAWAGLGNAMEAEAAIRRAALLAPPTPRGRWWLAAIQLARGELEAAKATWSELAAQRPEDRWAWWAAAMLTHPLLEKMSGASLAWPTDRELALVTPAEAAPLPRVEASRAASDARAWLLAEQRADGSWPTPSEVGQTEHRRERNRFLQANAALGGWALLPTDREAAGRALEWLLGSLERERVRSPDDEPDFMDYTPWSAAYAVHFLSASLEAGLGEAPRVREALAQTVSQLEARQKANGGWSYYLSPTLEGSKRPSGQAISFTTGTVVLALQHAERAGAALPVGMLSRGLETLEGMREPSGVFSYFLEADGSRARVTGIPGAAARGPVCCLPLLRAGREDLDALRKRFAIYAEHLPELAREQGKVMMHAGADTQGSHYLLYDYAMAAIAQRELPAAERGDLRGVILDALLAARCADGSYVDNPSVGRHSATALALLAFAALDLPTAD